jgi:hypothetical protein
LLIGLVVILTYATLPQTSDCYLEVPQGDGRHKLMYGNCSAIKDLIMPKVFAFNESNDIGLDWCSVCNNKTVSIRMLTPQEETVHQVEPGFKPEAIEINVTGKDCPTPTTLPCPPCVEKTCPTCITCPVCLSTVVPNEKVLSCINDGRPANDNPIWQDGWFKKRNVDRECAGGIASKYKEAPSISTMWNKDKPCTNNYTMMIAYQTIDGNKGFYLNRTLDQFGHVMWAWNTSQCTSSAMWVYQP